MTPDLTVVIATRDRTKPLERCLEALRHQVGVEALSILVVDDGSRDCSGVMAVAGRHGAELLAEPARGQSAARNAGVAQTRTRFVAFLDDDTMPAATWAASVLRRLHAGALAVTGPIAADRRRGPLGVASQIAANALVDVDAESKLTTRSTPSANLACRVDIARAIPFDEAYTRVDSPVGAEDRDWCARLAAAGGEVAFEPDARVVHDQQLTLREFCRRQYRYGRGARLYRVRHERGRLAPARFYVNLLRKGFEAGASVGLLLAAAQVATAAGYVRQTLAPAAAGPEDRLSRRKESEAESRAA